MKNSSASSAIFWWIAWITLTIASFFVCSAFWTPIVARHAGPMSEPAVPLIWVALVFGSWMVLLVPLIVVMYQKVDKAYEDARLARERSAHAKNQAIWGVKSVRVDAERRRLSGDVSRKLRGVPEALRKGHLVHLRLRDGRRIDYAFVLDRRELLGVYGRDAVDFDATDVVDLEPADLDRLPPFETEKWLRLDGAGPAS